MTQNAFICQGRIFPLFLYIYNRFSKNLSRLISLFPRPHLAVRLQYIQRKLKSVLRRLLIFSERVSGVEPPSHPWQGRIITTIRHPPTLRFGEASPLLRSVCRGKESDLRPLLFQSSALPLSYPVKFYNVGAMSSKSFPKALLPLRGTIQGIGSRHITPDIFKAAINGVLNILWAL